MNSSSAGPKTQWTCGCFRCVGWVENVLPRCVRWRPRRRIPFFGRILAVKNGATAAPLSRFADVGVLRVKQKRMGKMRTRHSKPVFNEVSFFMTFQEKTHSELRCFQNVEISTMQCFSSMVENHGFFMRVCQKSQIVWSDFPSNSATSFGLVICEHGQKWW